MVLRVCEVGLESRYNDQELCEVVNKDNECMKVEGKEF
jgi:hypothetical protein